MLCPRGHKNEQVTKDMGKKKREIAEEPIKVERPTVKPVPQMTYRYAPQPDITAFEVAQLLEFVALAMTRGDLVAAYQRLPDEVKRHLEVQE